MRRLWPMWPVMLLVLASSVFPQDLPKMDIEQYTLSNGLNVILQRDTATPTVAVQIMYHVGSKNEKPGRTGFAHLFEHMMFQGSKNHDQDYFTPLEKVGAEVNASTFEDKTRYYEVVPSSYLEKALWLEADRMGFLVPAMTQQKLDNQRDVVKNERRQRIENEPYAKSYEMSLQMLYPNEHAYSWSVIGSMADLSAASLEDVGDFFSTYYIPNNASLAIVGNFDVALTKGWVEKYFGPIPAGAPIDRMEQWLPKLDGVKRAWAEDYVKLPRVYMLWHTPALFAEGDAAFDLLATVLGSGKSSRLHKALVYEQQIAQDVNIYQDSKELVGTFNIEVTARPGHTADEIEQAIDAELKKLLATGVTAAELDAAKSDWESGFIRNLQNVSEKSFNIVNYSTFLGTGDMFQWDLERYRSITPNLLQKYVTEYLNLNERAIIHIVPYGTYAATEENFDRSVNPEPSGEFPFVPPGIETAKLSNGLEIYVVENHKLPLVHAQLLVKSGWSSDPATTVGAASMTASLLDEGTKTRNAIQISEAADRLGAQVGSTSSWDHSAVNCNVLKRNLDPALELLADIALNPSFPADEVERTRASRLSAIAQENNEPVGLGIKSFYRLLFGEGHPYGQGASGLGTESSIAALTREDLVEFYRSHYVPNNAALIFVGDITLSEARQRAERAFGKWQPGTVATVEVSAPKPLDRPKIVIIDRPNAPQSMIVAGGFGVSRNSPDYFPMQVANYMFGTSFISRINMNLREDKGYTYGSQVVVPTRKMTGPLFAYAPVQAQVTKESVAEILKEFREVVSSRPLTAQEVADSRDALIKGFPQGFQSFAGIASGVATLLSNTLPLDEWTRYQEQVSAVDLDEANQAINKYIRTDNILIVVVGDRAKIEPGLRELNIGEIVPMEVSQL